MSDEQALLLGKFENWSSKFSMGLSPATPVEWEELSDLMLTAAKQTRRLSAPPEAPQQPEARVDLAERLEQVADATERGDIMPMAFEQHMADLREAASALRASTEGESARVDGGDRRYLKAWVANLEGICVRYAKMGIDPGPALAKVLRDLEAIEEEAA